MPYFVPVPVSGKIKVNASLDEVAANATEADDNIDA
jgi:hypothetical protein